MPCVVARAIHCHPHTIALLVLRFRLSTWPPIRRHTKVTRSAQQAESFTRLSKLIDLRFDAIGILPLNLSNLAQLHS